MGRRARVVAAIAVALLAAGCGGNRDAAPNAESTSSTQTPEPTTSAPAQASGEMTFTYADASSPDAVHGRQLMQDAKFLEGVTENANDILNLPHDVPVIAKQCDEENAFWSPDDQNMTICYEDMEHSYRIFVADGDQDPAASAVNAEIATFYHELGHAVLDIYDLPFTGREEDVADQLAAYMLLAPGADGKPDPDGVQIATDFARMFKGYSDETGGDIDQSSFYDTHSFDLTRMYNFECWIYGADPADNGKIVTDGLLPEDRADGCESEYDKMSAAWQQMLGPHMK